MPPSRREQVAVALLLAAVLCLAFRDVAFCGKSLVYSDNFNPLDYRISAQTHGEHFVPASAWMAHNLAFSTNTHDPGASFYQWEPLAVFLRAGLRHAEMPWWDPYVAAGAPSMANLTPTYFFPPYFLSIVLGNTLFLKHALFLSLLWMAGFFTYVLLRQHALSRGASLLGASAFMLSGALVQNVGSFIAHPVACLPLLLLLSRRLLDRPSPLRMIQLALALSAVALASFPPVLIPTMGLVGAYLLAALAGPGTREIERQRLVSTRYLALGATALSLGLVAFYYVPVVALVREVAHARVDYENAAFTDPLSWRTLFELISPTLVGGTKILSEPALPVPVRELPYLGIVPVLLVPLARPHGERAQRLLFWCAAIGTLVLGEMAFGLPPFNWLGFLPIINTIHASVYLGIPLSFLLALLAAYGWDGLARRASFAPVTFVLFLGSAVMGALYFWASRAGVFQRPVGPAWMSEWRLVVALGVGLVAAMLLARTAKGAALGSGMIVALIVAQGACDASYPRQNRWDVWRHPVPYVQKLQEEKGRVFGMALLEPNASSAFAIPDIGSLLTFNPPRVFALYKRYFNPESTRFMREAHMVPPEPVLDAAAIELLAIRNVLTTLVSEADRRHYQRVFDDGYATIFRRPSAPHYYFTTQYQLSGDGLERLGGMPPRAGILLESAPNWSAIPDTAEEAPITILHTGYNGYTLALHAPRAGFVYCADSYFSGWTARVNGAPAAIVPANYAFRAVEVPAGDVVVELRYWPPGLTLGLVLSAVSLIFVVWIGLRNAAAIKGSARDDGRGGTPQLHELATPTTPIPAVGKKERRAASETASSTAPSAP